VSDQGTDLHPAFNPPPASPTSAAPADRSDPRDHFKIQRSRQDGDLGTRQEYETPRATALREKHGAEAEARERAAAGLPPRQGTALGEPPTSGAGEKFRIGDLELSAAEWNEVAAFKAADDSRRATLPKEADYKIELPADFVVPQGIEFSLKTDDPAYGHLRKMASEVGLSQEQFSKAIGIYAAQKVGEAQKLQMALAAERQKMGPTGTARMTAVQTFLNAKLGDLAASLILPLATEKQVRAYERIMQLVTGQGAADFSGAHRDPPTDGRTGGRIPGFESMTFTQRRAAQDAAKAGR
jgi:hypothetical protein